jgi:GNAT superfamily N-acetyltransferase
MPARRRACGRPAPGRCATRTTWCWSLGTLLLTRAIATCRAAGEPRIGLSVTDGNPAERLYAALGFRRRRTLFLLDTG